MLRAAETRAAVVSGTRLVMPPVPPWPSAARRAFSYRGRGAAAAAHEDRDHDGGSDRWAPAV